MLRKNSINWFRIFAKDEDETKIPLAHSGSGPANRCIISSSHGSGEAAVVFGRIPEIMEICWFNLYTIAWRLYEILENHWAYYGCRRRCTDRKKVPKDNVIQQYIR
jgi:hypothetical protein